MPYVAPVDYHNNSDKLYLKFVGDIDSEKNKDYGYDLYSFSVIEKDGAKYFILIQDYQVRPTLESVRKQMLEQN
jgi:starvation-inducible outer membrane lipoprotein